MVTYQRASCITSYLQLEGLEFSGSEGVSFGYDWNNIHQIVQLLHELNV